MNNKWWRVFTLLWHMLFLVLLPSAAAQDCIHAHTNTQPPTHTHSLSVCLSLSLAHTHTTHSLSLTISLCLSLSLSLSVSLIHTYTHTYIHTYTHTSPASPAAAAWTCIVVPFWDYNHITIIYVTSWNTSHHHKRYIICMNDKYFYITHTYICIDIYTYIYIYIYIMSWGVFVCFIYVTITYAVLDIITLCRSASLHCCARFLVPPFWSTCLRSASL